MKSLQPELDLAKSAVIESLQVLASLRPEETVFGFSASVPREVKSASDQILEDVILTRLRDTGLEILSEEVGHISGDIESELNWVVDPLDGTVNFIRGLSSCSVSLALCYGRKPILGVVGEFPSFELAWGGVGMGAFLSGQPIQVSKVSEKNQAVICTGFPSRFEFDSEGMQWIASVLAPYAKVRMLGAASLSLLKVAKGAAEVYTERDIMIWDVAAGLAILEGAGGIYSMSKGNYSNAFEIYASNGLIMDY